MFYIQVYTLTSEVLSASHRENRQRIRVRLDLYLDNEIKYQRVFVQIDLSNKVLFSNIE